MKRSRKLRTFYTKVKHFRFSVTVICGRKSGWKESRDVQNNMQNKHTAKISQ